MLVTIITIIAIAATTMSIRSAMAERYSKSPDERAPRMRYILISLVTCATATFTVFAGLPLFALSLTWGIFSPAVDDMRAHVNEIEPVEEHVGKHLYYHDGNYVISDRALDSFDDYDKKSDFKLFRNPSGFGGMLIVEQKPEGELDPDRPVSYRVYSRYDPLVRTECSLRVLKVPEGAKIIHIGLKGDDNVGSEE